MKTVLLAMSGGVDSSASAAILKEKGYCVAGIFFRLHDYYRESEKNANNVARGLGIDLCVFDHRKEFKEKIIDYFLKASREGITPNPCVLCNKIVKFDLLFENLKRFKADYLATGHYAISKNGRLFKGKDPQKDQSYFLWKLNKEVLSKTVFPMGNYTKEETRKLARQFKLPVWNREESQDVCFINSDLIRFFREHLRANPGKIINANGKIIGEHQGLWFYTIGQRKGLGFGGGPYYVLKKDISNNILIITKDKKDLLSKEVDFKEANWISGREPEFPIKVKGKIRSAHKPAQTVLESGSRLVFKNPQEAITPGQSVVFYKGRELLGGGIIA